MANYLETYYRNYNPAYRNYTNSGGDCTNFASQALYAGGWQEVSGFYWSENCWWYSDSNETRSWIGVEHWANFARNSNRVTV